MSRSTPLDAAAEAEFLAGVELLDSIAILQDWFAGQRKIGEQQRDAFLADLSESAGMLFRSGPLMAFADHGRRRFEHLLSGFSEGQRLNAECMTRLVRLHRNFSDAFVSSQAVERDDVKR